MPERYNPDQDNEIYPSVDKYDQPDYREMKELTTEQRGIIRKIKIYLQDQEISPLHKLRFHLDEYNKKDLEAEAQKIKDLINLGREKGLDNQQMGISEEYIGDLDKVLADSEQHKISETVEGQRSDSHS